MKLHIILARLRHAYANLIAGTVKDQTKFAEGLIAPVIKELETAVARRIDIMVDEVGEPVMGPADRCIHCGEISGPLMLRRHPRFAVRSLIDIDGELHDITAYAHTRPDAEIIAKRLNGASLPQYIERWDDQAREWVDAGE